MKNERWRVAKSANQLTWRPFFTIKIGSYQSTPTRTTLDRRPLKKAPWRNSWFISRCRWKEKMYWTDLMKLASIGPCQPLLRRSNPRSQRLDQFIRLTVSAGCVSQDIPVSCGNDYHQNGAKRPLISSRRWLNRCVTILEHYSWAGEKRKESCFNGGESSSI